MRVIVDSGYLGELCRDKLQKQFSAWIKERTKDDSFVLLIPDIADYELRRDLLRRSKYETDPIQKKACRRSLRKLDELRKELRSLRLTKGVLDGAAGLWADARAQGKPTAADKSIDVDAIIASHVVRERRNDPEFGEVQLLSKDSDFLRYNITPLHPLA